MCNRVIASATVPRGALRAWLVAPSIALLSGSSSLYYNTMENSVSLTGYLSPPPPSIPDQSLLFCPTSSWP